MCRIVTCTPPWQFDPSCSTASRTDNRTRNHTAACLNPFFGNIDAIVDVGGALKISGWLINRESQAPSSIKLFVDETPVVVTKTGVARPDVNKAYPNFPGNHGFEATIPAKAGRRVVCLYALQPGAKDTFITFKSQSVAGFLHGFDSVTTTPGVITTPDDETTPEDETVIGPAQIKVAGWVSDGRNFSQSAYVRVTINGVNKGTFIADSSRADVVKVYPCVTRRCGFNLSFPTEPGTYDVCVELDYRNGRTAPLGCKKVTVP